MSNQSRRDFAMTAGLTAAAGISISRALGKEPDKKKVDDPASFTDRFATVNGIRMHYVEEGKGPLVILLHGYPFLWYLWRHQIKALAAASYRVVASDQRGYGQTDCPKNVDAYDMTHLVGDVVGLMNALKSKSAVLVGQDWGSPVAYNTALMRPDLVRAVLMMCAPPAARSAVRPSEAMKQIFKGLNFYQLYFATSEANTEIMRDLRRFLLGVFYSTSGYCPVHKQWRWAWKSPETFSDTYTVPATLPPSLSQQALDYYVGEFTRTGVQPANNWYVAIDKGWENTSFLDGAIVQQPALFLTGDCDPASVRDRPARAGPQIAKNKLPGHARDHHDAGCWSYTARRATRRNQRDCSEVLEGGRLLAVALRLDRRALLVVPISAARWRPLRREIHVRAAF